MGFKKLLSLGSALVLSVTSLVTVTLPSLVHATPLTCTWTGATNNNWSVAGNWSSCNSAAPVNGSNLVFDVTSLSSSKTLTNDISNLSLGTITLQGNNSPNNHGYIITGNTISLSGGVVASAYNNAVDLGITLTANQTFSGTIGTVFGGTVTLGTYNLQVTAPFVTFYGLSGSGNLTLNGSQGSNYGLNDASPNFSGAIQANTGDTINLSDPAAAGTGAITIANGAALSVASGTNADTATLANNITIAGTGFYAYGAITSCLGVTQACTGDGNNTNLTLSGNITLTGNTQIANGAYYPNQTSAPAQTATFTLTGSLTANGFTLIGIPDSSTAIVTTSSAPATTVAAGDNQPGIGVTVPASSTYTIDGVRGDTTVADGGTLKGIGTVGNLNVNTGGTVAPGHSPGCLATGNLTLSGTYQAEVGGTTACTDYDQLNVTGTVNLTGSTLQTVLYNGFKPAKGQTYTIINNDGSGDAVTGTFTGLPEGATFTLSGYVFKISYVGGDGNDVVLSVVSVPAAPNTGFALVAAHPAETLMFSGMSALGLLLLANRARRSLKRR